MSHTVIAEFTCKEGMGEDFLATLLPALSDTRAHEGCELIETFVDEANPDRVLIWEKWATRQNQEAYLAWRGETGMIDMIGPFMAAPPNFIHLVPKD